MNKNAIPKDLIGMKVGELEVIEFSYRDKKSRQYWKCKCNACGNYKDMLRQNLLRGVVKTCGCQQGFFDYNSRTINTYDLNGDYGIGYTSKGEPFYFDLEDYEKIKDYNWHIDSHGYVECSCPKMRLHRFVLNVSDPNIIVDHIFHNKTDNRKSKLRIVTPSQNNINSTPRKHSSPYVGVSWHKNKKGWIAQIGLNGKLKYLGIFKNLEEARKAREKAEEEYFGEYCYQLNK